MSDVNFLPNIVHELPTLLSDPSERIVTRALLATLRLFVPSLTLVKCVIRMVKPRDDLGTTMMSPSRSNVSCVGLGRRGKVYYMLKVMWNCKR